MSQVKNLRAMFENKGDKSPPDRGRSPGVSTSSANPVGASGTGSPRPLSKVRTNFVAIEKDGRIGLRRDHSGESSLSRRRMSIETDAESTSTFPDKPVTTSSDGVSKPMRRLFVSEPLPPPSDALLFPTTPGAIGDKPSTNPDKQIDQEQSPTTLKPTDSTAGSALKAPRNAVMTPSPIEGRQPGQSQAGKSATPSKTARTVLNKPGASSQAPAGAQTKPITNGLQTAKTSTEAPKREANKSVKKSHETLGTRRGGTAAATRMTTTAPPRPRPSPNISTTTHKLQPSKGTGHGDTAITKPKPKSTTKSVNIPSSLTAPTASSVSKGSAARQSHSRQSGSLQNPNASSHSTTRAIPSGASPSAQLAGRPKSAINRPKPSVGLPPSKSFEPDVVVAKRSSHVDEGFLARMMRPTQASSSKTAEKVPSTPPKKPASRPSTAAAERNPRQVTNVRRPTLAKDETREKSESNSSQQAESGRTTVDIMHELSQAEPTDQVAGVPQDVSGAPTAEEPQPPENELRGVARVESGDVTAASSSPGTDPTEPQVQLQPATSFIACVETADEAVGFAQQTGLAQQPVQPVNVEPLSCASPVDESASESPSIHVTGGDIQADVGESATHGRPPLVSPDLPEPSTPPADIVHDEELKAKESVAESIDNVSTSSAPDAMKEREKIDNDAIPGSSGNAESPSEPPHSCFDSPLPEAQKTKTSESEHQLQ